MRSRCSKALLAGLAALAALPAVALEYRSVEPPAAILYDSPSQKGRKLYVIRRATPVEIVVSLEGWAKVRDAEGGLAWIEKKALSDKRTAIVVADRALVRRGADDAAMLAFEAEKGVALEIVEPAKDGWAKVRHSDGAAGFVRAKEVWGL